MFESFCWAYSLCRDLNSPEQTWTVLNSSSWMCYLTNIPCKNGFYLCFLWWNKQDSHKIGKLRTLRVFSWSFPFAREIKLWIFFVCEDLIFIKFMKFLLCSRRLIYLLPTVGWSWQVVGGGGRRNSRKIDPGRVAEWSEVSVKAAQSNFEWVWDDLGLNFSRNKFCSRQKRSNLA